MATVQAEVQSAQTALRVLVERLSANATTLTGDGIDVAAITEHASNFIGMLDGAFDLTSSAGSSRRADTQMQPAVEIQALKTQLKYQKKRTDAALMY